ncbi:hypothetical protein ACUY1T_14545 [Billgrantia sp. Q4P2]|uniref:hypothetical protein n=1 Tax=Billgrantia sp. Q4P2 TaxID=3463857 RepID=UPI0040561045
MLQSHTEAMNENQRLICTHLRELQSSEAASWLMDHYPNSSDNWDEALLVMPHRSWRKSDQIRLAKHYLSKLPFASARGYEVFASFMTVANLIAVIRGYIPADAEDKKLLEYHLAPVLRRKAESEKDLDAINSFLDALA